MFFKKMKFILITYCLSMLVALNNIESAATNATSELTETAALTTQQETDGTTATSESTEPAAPTTQQETDGTTATSESTEPTTQQGRSSTAEIENNLQSLHGLKNMTCLKNQYICDSGCCENIPTEAIAPTKASNLGRINAENIVATPPIVKQNDENGNLLDGFMHLYKFQNITCLQNQTFCTDGCCDVLPECNNVKCNLNAECKSVCKCRDGYVKEANGDCKIDNNLEDFVNLYGLKNSTCLQNQTICDTGCCDVLPELSICDNDECNTNVKCETVYFCECSQGYVKDENRDCIVAIRPSNVQQEINYSTVLNITKFGNPVGEQQTLSDRSQQVISPTLGKQAIKQKNANMKSDQENVEALAYLFTDISCPQNQKICPTGCCDDVTPDSSTCGNIKCLSNAYCNSYNICVCRNGYVKEANGDCIPAQKETIQATSIDQPKTSSKLDNSNANCHLPNCTSSKVIKNGTIVETPPVSSVVAPSTKDNDIGYYLIGGCVIALAALALFFFIYLSKSSSY